MSEQYAISFGSLTDALEHQHQRKVELGWDGYIRLFSQPIPERGRFGDRHPCAVCGGYSYGQVNGEALCVQHWLERRPQAGDSD